jgi:hypothetical protein
LFFEDICFFALHAIDAIQTRCIIKALVSVPMERAMTLNSASVRINVLLPAGVAKDLREYVPSRKRARFVAEAVERELRRLRLQAALEASAGAWQDEDHPDLADGPAIDRWIAEGRAQLAWDRREEV